MVQRGGGAQRGEITARCGGAEKVARADAGDLVQRLRD
jgi:hypothetical protein